MRIVYYPEHHRFDLYVSDTFADIHFAFKCIIAFLSGAILNHLLMITALPHEMAHVLVA